MTTPQPKPATIRKLIQFGNLRPRFKKTVNQVLEGLGEEWIKQNLDAPVSAIKKRVAEIKERKQRLEARARAIGPLGGEGASPFDVPVPLVRPTPAERRKVKAPESLRDLRTFVGRMEKHKQPLPRHIRDRLRRLEREEARLREMPKPGKIPLPSRRPGDQAEWDEAGRLVRSAITGPVPPVEEPEGLDALTKDPDGWPKRFADRYREEIKRLQEQARSNAWSDDEYQQRANTLYSVFAGQVRSQQQFFKDPEDPLPQPGEPVIRKGQYVGVEPLLRIRSNLTKRIQDQIKAGKITPKQAGDIFQTLLGRGGIREAIKAGTFGEYTPFWQAEKAEEALAEWMGPAVSRAVKSSLLAQQQKSVAPFIKAAQPLIDHLRSTGLGWQMGVDVPAKSRNENIERRLREDIADRIMDDVVHGRHREWPKDWKEVLSPHLKSVMEIPFYMTQEDIDQLAAEGKPISAFSMRRTRGRSGLPTVAQMASPIPTRAPAPKLVPTTETDLWRLGFRQHEGQTLESWRKATKGMSKKEKLRITGAADAERRFGGTLDPSLAQGIVDGVRRSLGNYFAEYLDVTKTSGRQKWRQAVGLTEKRIAERRKDPLVLNFIKNQKEFVENNIMLLGEVLGLLPDKLGDLTIGRYGEYLKRRGIVRPITRLEESLIRRASRGERISELGLGIGAGLKKMIEDPEGSFLADPLFFLQTFLGGTRGALSLPGVSRIVPRAKIAKMRSSLRNVERNLMAHNALLSVIGRRNQAPRRLLEGLDEAEGLRGWTRGKVSEWSDSVKSRIEAGEIKDLGGIQKAIAELPEVLQNEVMTSMVKDINPKIAERIGTGEGKISASLALQQALFDITPVGPVSPSRVIDVTPDDIVSQPTPPPLPTPDMPPLGPGRMTPEQRSVVTRMAMEQEPPPIRDLSPDDAPVVKDIIPEDAPVAPAEAASLSIQRIREKAPTPEDFFLDLQETPGAHRITVTPGPTASALADKLEANLRSRIADEVNQWTSQLEAEGKLKPGMIAWARNAPEKKLKEHLEAAADDLLDPTSAPLVAGVEGGQPYFSWLPTRRKDFLGEDVSTTEAARSTQLHLAQVIAGLRSGKPFEVIAGSPAAVKWIESLQPKLDAKGAMVGPPVASLFLRFEDWYQNRLKERKKAAELDALRSADPAAYRRYVEEGTAIPRDALDAAQAVGLPSPKGLPQWKRLSPEQRARLLKGMAVRAKANGERVVLAERSHLVDRELAMTDAILDGKVENMSPTVMTREVFDGLDPASAGRLGVSRFVEATPEAMKWMGRDGQPPLYVDKKINNYVKWENRIAKIPEGLGAFRWISSQFKRSLTSANPMTFVGNLVSNVFLRGIVRGDADISKLSKFGEELKAFRENPKYAPPHSKKSILEAEGQDRQKALRMIAENEDYKFKRIVLEQFERRGWGDFTSTEIRSATTPAVLKSIANLAESKSGRAGALTALALTPATKILGGMEKAYRGTDVIFKGEQGMHKAKLLKELGDKPDTKSITFPSRYGESTTIYFTRDGMGNVTSYHKGGPDGPKLTRDQYYKELANAGIYSGNQLYFDYAKVPQAIKAIRQSGLDMMFSPFYTWFYKAMYMPGLKEGLAKHVITGGLHGIKVDGNSAQRVLDASQLKQAAHRLAMVQSAHGSNLAYNDPDNSIMRTLSAYTQQRDQPFIGVLLGGPKSMMTKLSASGVSYGGADLPLARLLAPVERAIRGLKPNHPMLIGDEGDYSKEGSRAWLSLRQRLERHKANKGKKFKDRGTRSAIELLLTDPRRTQELVSEIREQFPPLGHWTTELQKILGLEKGGAITLGEAFQEVFSPDPNSYQMQTLLGVLLGSQAIPKIAKKGARGYVGVTDIDLAEDPAIGDPFLKKRLDGLEKEWIERASPHSKTSILEAQRKDPAKALRMIAENEARVFLIRTHMDLARMELVDQLRRMHYDVTGDKGKLVRPTFAERRKSERKYQEEGKERRLKETKRLIHEFKRRGVTIPRGLQSKIKRAIEKEKQERR